MEYIVQSGDTLSHIAERKLGRASRWPEIVQLNHLSNPNLIFVGQKLKLPNNQLMQTPQTFSSMNAGLGGHQLPAHIALARGYLFIVFEQLPEVGTGKIIRKVAAIPRDLSLKPANLLGKLSPAEHVLNFNPSQSQFLSASNRAFGAPSINGQPLLLDVAKLRRAGAQIYSPSEIIRDLERFIAENPASRQQVNKLISTIRNIEGEVLITKVTPPGAASRLSTAHNAYVRSAEELWAEFHMNGMTRAQLEQELVNLERAYSRARVIGRVGRVLTVVGVVVTVADVARATQRSIDQRSFKPVSAEAIRQVGGWGAALAGMKIGFATGAFFGIETGPGAIATGAIGALVFGAAGYFGADWVADHISPN